jgi:hypothetical protein
MSFKHPFGWNQNSLRGRFQPEGLTGRRVGSTSRRPLPAKNPGYMLSALAPVLVDRLWPVGPAPRKVVWIGTMSSAVNVKNRNLNDPAYITKIRARPANGVYSTERPYRIWSLLMLETWCRIFIDNRGELILN